MHTFPPITHLALTVRHLSVSVPWYEALFEAGPAIDEDTDPDMHHTVYVVGNGTLIGLHQHATRPADAAFSEFNVGLDTSRSAARTVTNSRSGPVDSTSSASRTATSRTRGTAPA